MDSSSIARYIPQISKKRVFPGSSSNGGGNMEPGVIEIAPPSANSTSKRKAKGKQDFQVQNILKSGEDSWATWLLHDKSSLKLCQFRVVCTRVVLKGGLSSGYKNCIANKGLNDETYSSDGVALIQISGTSVHNNKAVQVEAVATSLNSYYCFLLQSGSSLFTWHGNQSAVGQHNIAAKIAEFLKVHDHTRHAQECANVQTLRS